MAGSLEARIRSLEDRAELGELIARYALAVDDRDFDTIARLFSSDCVFENVKGIERGRERVVAYYRERLGEFGPTYHIPHVQSLEVLDGDHARGTVLAHAELAINGITYMVALRYLDDYVRENERWCFQQRRVRQLYAMPLSELPEGLAATLRKRWPGSEPAAGDWPASEVL
jgi:ketosteroid isomerase-like protein